ncbi:hypothetical protein AMTRI_Chr09g19520 [Amborella trichopoda]|uniref:Uncharacterized protein n=1 Tax=Amborella trichopoda TaxID=13333 RepID=W1PL92_AMBTC|nr:auxin-responsive protein SAUR32 [Amborella trichopoda]ERN10762.1 hypothetical protein AMTR_s00027p00198570 [Amborella trichopoda]|eukprot:XP_006849181.1 auxin-responsive protein SAUR32 [Amborella trichopoda]
MFDASIQAAMGGDKHHHHLHLHLLSFHLHHHGKKEESLSRTIPKGYLAVMVGVGGEQERFVIPVAYFNHPLFVQLLKEAEDEYGFEQKGTITIPCHVAEFRYVQGLIDKEMAPHTHQVGCFRALKAR